MPRVVKDPETRRRELLAAAGKLFADQGYQNTTIDAIIQKTGVAKGTFYYYFRNKVDILEALAREIVLRQVAAAQNLAKTPGLSAMEKARLVLGKPQQLDQFESSVLESLHQPENRELHERINVETVLLLSPVLAIIIDQGNKEGVFHVERPLETVQFLLTGMQFLLDAAYFRWTGEERAERHRVIQASIERTLGAHPGLLEFLLSK